MSVALQKCNGLLIYSAVTRVVVSLQRVLKRCQVVQVIRLYMMLILENLQDMVRLKGNRT